MSCEAEDRGFDGPYDVGEHAQGLDYGDDDYWPAPASAVAPAALPHAEGCIYQDIMKWDVSHVQRWAEAVVGTLT